MYKHNNIVKVVKILRFTTKCNFYCTPKSLSKKLIHPKAHINSIVDCFMHTHKVTVITSYEV